MELLDLRSKEGRAINWVLGSDAILGYVKGLDPRNRAGIGGETLCFRIDKVKGAGYSLTGYKGVNLGAFQAFEKAQEAAEKNLEGLMLMGLNKRGELE